MTPYRNTRSSSMKYKDSLDIFPDTSPNSPSLPKYDFDHLQYKTQTMNKNIHNDIKALTDMTNKHQSEMKTTNDNISTMLQKLTDGVLQERRRTVNPLRGKTEFLANELLR